MGRTKARDNAFKCIYELSFDHNINLDVIINHCFEENDNTEDEKEYINLLVKGVNDKLDEIDDIILKNLKNWSIDRIAKIDLAILRIAIYEIVYIEDLSNKVSANEAVELAKEYGLETSPNFVNGVIAKVISDTKGE